MNIGVIGYSGPVDKPPVSEIAHVCLNIGRLIVDKGHTLFSGGRDGVMELVSRGAKERGGMVVGVLPFDQQGNTHNTVGIKTGMDFMTRSLILVHSVDIVISLGGEIGTLFEIVAAYGYGKDVILVSGTGGVTDRVKALLIEDRYLDSRKLADVRTIISLSDLDSLL